MNHHRLIVALLCLLTAVRSAPAQGLDVPAVDKIFAAWDRRDSPGCALAIVRDGRIVYSRGYGMADLDHGVTIGPGTVFNIASVSKQFTVFLIMMLVQAGLLDLDDDVRRHVPELPDFGKTITIRHLIHHTSGLREDWSLLGLSGWRTEDLVTQRDVLGLLYRQKELNFAPGDQHLYCNSGYQLLALVAQADNPSNVLLRRRSSRRWA
jgi:CubicO group peptidase (beta-lactamase class C family)